MCPNAPWQGECYICHPLSLSGMHAVPKGHKYALYWGPGCGYCCRALEPAQADCTQGVANCWSEACTVSSNSSLPFPQIRPGWITCIGEIKAIMQK